MSVVLDANALVVLALDRQRATAVKARLREWRDAGDELHAPELQRYEAANALARAVATGQLPASEVTAAWEVITAVPVTLHRLEDGPEVVAMTQRLERKSAYDAAYLVLADRLGADLWTLDGPLARNARSRGLRFDSSKRDRVRRVVKRASNEPQRTDRFQTAPPPAPGP